MPGHPALWASGLVPPELHSPPFGQTGGSTSLLEIVALLTGAEVFEFKAGKEKKGVWGWVGGGEGIMCRKHLLYIKKSF